MELPIYLVVCERDGQQYCLAALGVDGAKSAVLKLDRANAETMAHVLNDAYGEDTWAIQQLEEPPL